MVLAAAAGVPALAIDYRPKCRDFQASIGRSEWVVSTLEVTRDVILDAVVELHEDRDRHVRAIRDHVDRARTKLEEGERVAAELLSGSSGVVLRAS